MLSLIISLIHIVYQHICKQRDEENMKIDYHTR